MNISLLPRVLCAGALSVSCLFSGVIPPAQAQTAVDETAVLAEEFEGELPSEDTVVEFEESTPVQPVPSPEMQQGRAMQDSDNDGFPDEWEKHGFTRENGEEVPLHMWGVDPTKPDIFLQLNWMKPGDGRNFMPHKKTLNDLVRLFADNGVNLHIDAGDYYTNIPNYPVRRGGETMEYAQAKFAGDPESEFAFMLELGEELGDMRGIFRVGMIMDGIDGSGKSGVGQYQGNAFLISKGERMSERFMRNTILHEMGHLFGLSHHGHERNEQADKAGEFYPNYRSVMNYLYQYFVFDYSHEPSEYSKRKSIVCLNGWAKCYKGTYSVDADWDHLNFRTGDVGNFYAATGVSKEAEDKVQGVSPTDLTAGPYTSSDYISDHTSKILKLLVAIFGTSFAVLGLYSRGHYNELIDAWGIPVPKVYR